MSASSRYTLGGKEVTPAALRATPSRGQRLRPGEAGSTAFLVFGCSSWRIGFRGEPGLGPAAELLFFASPKKSSQKKGEPKSGPLRGALRCSGRPGCAQTRLSPQTCAPLFPVAPALLSPASRQSRGSDSPSGESVWLPLPLGEGVKTPYPEGKSAPALRRHALASSAGLGGSGLRMSEGRAADKFAQTPPGPSNAACPSRSGGTAHSARLSFAYFSLAKQRKVSRPPGRDPACRDSESA